MTPEETRITSLGAEGGLFATNDEEAAERANQARNFVLCPGGAYDRSPCGTGTSAKLACLAADGKLQPGEVWRQESILGSTFTGRYRWIENQNAALIVEIDEEAALRPARQLAINIIIIGLLVSVIMIFIVVIISQRISAP